MNETLARLNADEDCPDCDGTGIVVKNEEEDMYCHCTKERKLEDEGDSRRVDQWIFNHSIK